MPPQHNNPLQNTLEPAIQTHTHKRTLGQISAEFADGWSWKCCFRTNPENTVLSRLCYGTDCRSGMLECYFQRRRTQNPHSSLATQPGESGGGKKRGVNP